MSTEAGHGCEAHVHATYHALLSSATLIQLCIIPSGGVFSFTLTKRIETELSVKKTVQRKRFYFVKFFPKFKSAIDDKSHLESSKLNNIIIK